MLTWKDTHGSTHRNTANICTVKVSHVDQHSHHRGRPESPMNSPSAAAHLFQNLHSADSVHQGCFVHYSKPPLSHLKGGREPLCPSMHLFIWPAHQATAAGHLCHGGLGGDISTCIFRTTWTHFFCVRVCVLPECVVDQERSVLVPLTEAWREVGQVWAVLSHSEFEWKHQMQLSAWTCTTKRL